LSKLEQAAEVIGAAPALRLDIAANRAKGKYSRREQLARVAWAAVQPLFRWSPRRLFAWRAWLLRRFRARLGPDVHVYPSVRIAQPWNLEIGDQSAVGEGVRIYNLGAVRIGARATVSQHAHLCAGTHDYESADMPLVKAPITIGDDVWIAADAFVGPGVTVGAGAVVGARSAVFNDVAPWTVVGGNPAQVLKTRTLRYGDRRGG
jgi:putative colanic acid biosynthesis acetyltransferase WcaF